MQAYSATREDIKALAVEIENIAKELQERLSDNRNFLPAANALAAKNTTFVFAVGEVYALERTAEDMKSRVQSVISKSKRTGCCPRLNYHNIRNALGRFSRKL